MNDAEPIPRPSEHPLIRAYLGHFFREASDRGDSYEHQAERLGVSKQIVLKLANRWHVGPDRLFALARGMTDGSVDALLHRAIHWWGQLSDERKRQIAEWAKRGGPAPIKAKLAHQAAQKARASRSSASGDDRTHRRRRPVTSIRGSR